MMTLDKTCACCNREKSPDGYFFREGVGLSAFCKKCHAAGKIKHGYGWYGDRYTSPETTGAAELKEVQQ